MQNIELFVSAALCIAGEVFDSSTKNSNPASVAIIVMVCGQSIIHNHFNSF
jgi:hypothetical protein